MFAENIIPEQDKFTLKFKDEQLEREFLASYDKGIRMPVRYGIIISILSWYSAIALIAAIIPAEFIWFSILTFVYIGSFFGFIVYSTYSSKFKGYYHVLAAISNAWAGLYVIYFCNQFPNGENLTLPVLIFIIFFGLYMMRLRWMAGFLAALTYIIAYHIYIANFADVTPAQIMLYTFVGWMTLIFAVLAGRVAESNGRIAYVQRKTIREQARIIEHEKEILLKEVHHRVKNNLQIIVSLINLQVSKLDDKTVEATLRETQSRVMSMSLVHQKMNQTSNFAEISLEDYTRQMIGNIEYLFPDKKSDYELNVPSVVRVDIETAIPLGLIINEIVTNFFKHCASDTEQNKFSIEVKEDENKSCIIRYRDNGKGFPEGTTIDNSTTLGLDLIDGLMDQVSGVFKFYNDGGAVYEIYLDLSFFPLNLPYRPLKSFREPTRLESYQWTYSRAPSLLDW
jgi:two-component sensor histidine kinase